MKSAIGCIVQSALYKKGDKINILSTPYSIKYIEQLYDKNTEIYMWEDGNNPFQETTNKIHLINDTKSILPQHLNFDTILCHDMLNQYQFAIKISESLHIPIVLIEHKTKKEYGQQLTTIQQIKVSDILFDSKEISNSWTNTSEHRILTKPNDIREKLERVLGKTHIKL